MMRWLVDLDCDATRVVLTTGDDPTLGHADDWFCRECGRCRAVKAVHQIGWELAPPLKLRDQP
jgi:hypothetical protein